MTLTRKSFLIILSFFIAACGSISNERTSDASAVSTSASGAYSDQGLTSSNILYFAYDKSDVNSLKLLLYSIIYGLKKDLG